jgi:hypothetical protein
MHPSLMLSVVCALHVSFMLSVTNKLFMVRVILLNVILLSDSEKRSSLLWHGATSPTQKRHTLTSYIAGSLE